MSFGEFYAATSGIGKAYTDGLAQFDKKQMLGALGTRLQAGDYAGASKVAFDAGDPDTGLSLLKLGQSAKQSADANAAFSSFGRAYAGGGTPQPLGALGTQPAAGPAAPRGPAFASADGAAGDYLKTVRGVESGGNPNARNPNSTATGIDQFTAGTWAGLARKYPELGLTPNGRTDPAQSTRAMEAFTRDNAKALTAAGVPITPGNLYVSHFLGEAGGPKFIAGAMQNPDAPATAFVSPGAAAANRTIFYNRDGTPKTAGQVYAERTSKFGGGAPQASAQAAPVQVASADPSFMPTPAGAPMGAAPAAPAPAGPTMTMPDAAPEATPEARAQVSAAVPQQLAQAGLPPAAAQQVGATAPASQQRIGALIRLATMPGLSEGQSGVVKTLLSNELEQTKAPDEVKKYLFARGQGYGGTFVDFQREGQRPVGPQTVSAGSALVDPNTGRVIFQAPDKEGGGVTLSPGQVRFDAQGRRIAEVADRDKSNEGEAKLRTEFTKQLGTFNEVQDGYRRLIAATAQRESNPDAVSPASDIGLVFGFMKMLDPGSVVREGEFASAQNATGVPERIQNLYNKALNGEILNPTQRQDFIDTAGRLYSQARQGAESVATRYGDLAKGQGLDVGRVVALPPTLSAPKVGRPKASTTAPASTPKFQEGDIAVNPQTNEELVRRGGKWIPNTRPEL